ncbi:MAG: Gfo/Idh/MocA family oxidoreductase [Mycobacteriales bacterium]
MPLRLGLLGAAKIAHQAVVKPTRIVEEVTLAAVAARDPARAKAYATKYAIPTVHATYDDLLADPSIDVVYNPLPNGLHAEWTLKALAAGKHVLCEKPFTSNADEARTVADAAEASGLIVMEAFHYRYHPLAERMLAIAHSGELGTIREVRTALCFPLPRFRDIRYRYDLGGGAMMDAGCYALHALRLLGPSEPEVVAATARLHSPSIDRAMSADFRFEGGATGHLEASMWSRRLLRINATLVGDRGRMSVFNFVAPHLFHRLSVTVDGTTTRERVPGEATYTEQLRRFAGAVLRDEPFPTTARDAVVTMALIDDVYVAAGMTPRGS